MAVYLDQLKNPLDTNSCNIDCFLTVGQSAIDMGVKNMIYASSSSVYGDTPHLPKKKNTCGAPLSPYAVSKITNELYADMFHKNHGLNTIGLRYFNVFGPYQRSKGPYTNVIPLWINNFRINKDIYINGDGTITRDLCYIDNVVQANIRAALTKNPAALNKKYNIGCGKKNKPKHPISPTPRRIRH